MQQDTAHANEKLRTSTFQICVPSGLCDFQVNMAKQRDDRRGKLPRQGGQGGGYHGGGPPPVIPEPWPIYVFLSIHNSLILPTSLKHAHDSSFPASTF